MKKRELAPIGTAVEGHEQGGVGRRRSELVVHLVEPTVLHVRAGAEFGAGTVEQHHLAIARVDVGAGDGDEGVVVRPGLRAIEVEVVRGDV